MNFKEFYLSNPKSYQYIFTSTDDFGTYEIFCIPINDEEAYLAGLSPNVLPHGNGETGSIRKIDHFGWNDCIMIDWFEASGISVLCNCNIVLLLSKGCQCGGK